MKVKLTVEYGREVYGLGFDTDELSPNTRESRVLHLKYLFQSIIRHLYGDTYSVEVHERKEPTNEES